MPHVTEVVSKLMKSVYSRIWSLSKPYYQRGRKTDVAHILWMMDIALFVCEKEKLDDTLLIPLVILHDVGYSKIKKGNPFNIDIRKAHMAEGTKLSEEILKSVAYPDSKIPIIVHYVSIHDNWALGDNAIYKNDIILGVFNDLDFIWMATQEGFSAVAKIHGFEPMEMINFLEKNEKLVKRPFCSKSVALIFKEYLTKRYKELQL